MSLETEVFSALRGLVSDRVYPVEFPQPNGMLPTWPAIRYTLISSVPVVDLGGDGDDQTADMRLQIDIVDTTYTSARSLRLAVMAAMRNLFTPATLASSGDQFDTETKTYREMLEYDVNGSSDPSYDSPT